MQHLKAVLGELQATGLTAHPKMCSIWQLEAKYLGFKVGQDWIRPSADKVEAI